MKATEKLKKTFMDTMRGQASWPEPLDVSEACIVLDLTESLPADSEGMVSFWSVRKITSHSGLLQLICVSHVDLGDGVVDEGEELEILGEDELESQPVEMVEFVAEAVKAAWEKRCEEKGLAH
jgi:hypothetical protein